MRVLRSACGTVRRGAPEEALGLDRSAAQATDSEGTVHRMTDTSVAEAGIRRHQRKVARQLKGSNRRRTGHRLSKLHRQRIRIRDNDTPRRAASAPTSPRQPPSCGLREPLLRADDRIPRPFHGSGPMSTEQRLCPAVTGIHRSVTVGLEWAVSGVSWQSRQSLRGPWPTGTPRRPERVAFVAGSSGESLAIGGNPCRD